MAWQGPHITMIILQLLHYYVTRNFYSLLRSQLFSHFSYCSMLWSSPLDHLITYLYSILIIATEMRLRGAKILVCFLNRTKY